MKLRALHALLFVVATSASASIASASALYVGTQQGCNEGIVTTDPNLMGCSTVPYGYTGPQRYSTVALFSGLTPGVNAGLVSTYPDFLGGTTRFIGYAVLNGDPTKRLYGGAVEVATKATSRTIRTSGDARRRLSATRTIDGCALSLRLYQRTIHQ